MSKRPVAVDRLDALLSTSMIAHEAIFEMRRELIVRGRGSAEQTRLLGESSRIVVEKLPGLTAVARGLAGRWVEQTLLDPDAAEATLGEIATELELIEPEVEALLGRQRQIAARLRQMLEP